MALDPRFVLAPSLQEYFVDKLTGLPLSHGLVYFYSDVNRNTFKTVYALEGNPPYSTNSYIPLPNPVVLSGVGTIQDANGNDVIPYYFPFQGTPAQNNSTQELYYVVVTDEFGVQQFTREGWPNSGTTGGNAAVSTNNNYVPNGQFLIHNASYPNTPQTTFNYGIYTTNVKEVAPGGWTYEVINTSTAFATDEVLFLPRNKQFTTTESSSPRYHLEIKRTTPSNDSIVDIRIKWMDVFKFASVTGTTPTESAPFTFIFTVINNGAPLIAQIFQILYYGTSPVGGTIPSITAQIPFGTGPLTIPVGGPLQIPVTGTFAVNSPGNIVGDNDDDFIQLAIRFPALAGNTFDISITDVMLFQGSNFTLPITFPTTTNGKFLLDALSNVAPTSRPAGESYYSEDGSNLYLPMVMTPEGYTYDYGQIGTVIAKSSQTDFDINGFSTVSNEVIADGRSLLATGYSPLGIPFLRLSNKLPPFSAFQCRIWGNGTSFVNAQILDIPAASAFMGIYNVSPVSVTSANAATSGFTISDIFAPTIGIPTYGFKAFVGGSTFTTNIFSNSPIIAPFTGPIDGTGGKFVYTVYENSPGGYYFLQIQVNVPPAPGDFFRFASNSLYVWFTVNGVGVDPAPGGLGIKVQLSNTDTTNFVVSNMNAAINNAYAARITTLGEGAITTGSYWTFMARTPTSVQNYYVWYKKNGSGIDPAPGGIGIPVNITTGMSANQVNIATISAINRFYVGVPDLRGIFLRGADLGTNNDPSNISRYNIQQIYTTGGVGSYQFNEVRAHLHTAPAGTSFLTNAGALITAGINAGGLPSQVTDITGGPETRPINAAVIWAIKY